MKVRPAGGVRLVAAERIEGEGGNPGHLETK
jgi:hypothetical protein